MQPKELNILIGLHRVTNSIDKKTFSLVNKNGLTNSQFMALEALYSKGEMSIGEVRDKILSSVGTIPLIVNNLVKKGYIQRRTSEKDGRVCILHLTKEGYEVINKVAPQNVGLIIDSMSILHEEEKDQLLYLLKKLGGRIDGKKDKR